jgi:hypothetical protein
MSKANSSARQRRAGGAVLPGQDTKPISNATPQSGLSLQQVIALIDKRLVNLEIFAKDAKIEPASKETVFNAVKPEEINGLADEFNGKFEMLATEVAEIKDIVLKLQSYTMDVNKMLMEERVRILSYMESSGTIDINAQELNTDANVFTMSSTM